MVAVLVMLDRSPFSPIVTPLLQRLFGVYQLPPQYKSLDRLHSHELLNLHVAD